MGDLSPYKVGAHQHVPGDQAGHRRAARCRSRRCWRRCRAASWPPSPPGPTGARRRRRARGARRRRTRTSRSCTCCPRARGRTPRPRSAPTPATCRPPWTSTRGRVIVVSAHRQPRQGRRRPGRAVRQPDARPAGDRRACPSMRGRAVSVTAPEGLPGRRRRRRAQGQRRRSTSPWSSTTGPTPPRPACSPPTGSRPRRCCGASRCCAAGVVRAVVLNSGGANACTGPHGFQDTHATAEHAAAGCRGARLRSAPARWRSARPA